MHCAYTPCQVRYVATGLTCSLYSQTNMIDLSSHTKNATYSTQDPSVVALAGPRTTRPLAMLSAGMFSTTHVDSELPE